MKSMSKEVLRSPYSLPSHGRGHRFEPCAAHQNHKQDPTLTKTLPAPKRCDTALVRRTRASSDRLFRPTAGQHAFLASYAALLSAPIIVTGAPL